MNPTLTLLEGKWFPQMHVSVRDLFTPLFMVWTPRPQRSYHYEQFTNEKAFGAAIKYAFDPHRAHTIYIGAHGDKDAIHGFHDEGIRRTVVGNAFKQVPQGRKMGIYFGSCSFGNTETAGFMLTGKKQCTRLEWLAGYDKEVDWIDSTAPDLFFFRHFLFPNPGTGRKAPKTTHDKLHYACNRVCEDMRPLAKRLGFHIFVRKKGKGGGINDLMKDSS